MLELNQHSGAYGHGGQDPIGVVNILQTSDVFMTVSLPGVTTMQTGRSGSSWDVIKIPPIAVHVVQWLQDLKVQWRVIDMDGSVFDGLDPVFYFLRYHRLRHRCDNGQFGFGIPPPVINESANVFGSGFQRPLSGTNGSFVQVLPTDDRLAQMGCQSPPSKIPKRAILGPKRSSSPKPVSKVVQKVAPVTKPSVSGKGAELKKSFEVKQGQKESVAVEKKKMSAKLNSHINKEFDINMNRCKCMDSLGYLPFGCSCDENEKPSESPKLAPLLVPQDSLEIHAPEDSDLFGSNGPEPHLSASRSIPELNQNDNGIGSKDVSANEIFENLLLQPGDAAILFPPVLPPNPPGRRVPPILRWEVQIRRRPTDPTLPTASERRRLFVESIKPVRFDKSMKGKEYESVHEFEWKTLLG